MYFKDKKFKIFLGSKRLTCKEKSSPRSDDFERDYNRMQATYEELKRLATKENIINDNADDCNKLLWNLLAQLVLFVKKDFGFNDVKVFRICDLKTLGEVFDCAVSSKYPSPFMA